jgi:hypothetical protein
VRSRYEGLRWPWMIGTVVAVWAMWDLPYRLAPALYQSGALGMALVVVTGLLLGSGRQGIDLLTVRLFAATLGLLSATPAQCVGPADCLHAYEIGLVGFGAFGTVLFGLLAIPTNIVWNRGVKSLKPEFAWGRLAHLRRSQSIVLWLAIAGLATTFYISLGIPAAP